MRGRSSMAWRFPARAATAALYIVSVSAPPTQSTVSGAGQIGNTFTLPDERRDRGFWQRHGHRRLLGDLGDRIELHRHRFFDQHRRNLRHDGFARHLRGQQPARQPGDVFDHRLYRRDDLHRDQRADRHRRGEHRLLRRRGVEQHLRCFVRHRLGRHGNLYGFAQPDAGLVRLAGHHDRGQLFAARGAMQRQRRRRDRPQFPHRNAADHGRRLPVATGSPYDEGLDPFTGAWNQSAAFTCNIVAATVVQCVKGPVYSAACRPESANG